MPLPPPVAEIAVGGGFAWASNEAKGTVYKIDRSGQIVATYETGDGAREMSYADGTLWVVNQDVGTVTGIDAATGARRTFRFGHPLQSVAALHGKLLVEVNQGRTYEDRIDALKGKVARLIDPTYEFDHPDPAISGNGYVHSFMFQAERATCAPLLGYPDAPPPRGQHLVPEVAAAMPTLSPDRRTYTFTVRTGLSLRAALERAARRRRPSATRSSGRSTRSSARARPASTSSATSKARTRSTPDARRTCRASACAATASPSR